jgi:hypothetical protein
MANSINKKITKIFLLTAIILCNGSCNRSQISRDGCEKHTKEKIRPGLSIDAAEAELKKCGFETTRDPKATLDPAKKTLWGDKRVVRGLVTERTQVLIKFDADNKVVNVSVSFGLIGP